MGRAIPGRGERHPRDSLLVRSPVSGQSLGTQVGHFASVHSRGVTEGVPPSPSPAGASRLMFAGEECSGC